MFLASSSFIFVMICFYITLVHFTLCSGVITVAVMLLLSFLSDRRFYCLFLKDSSAPYLNAVSILTTLVILTLFSYLHFITIIVLLPLAFPCVFVICSLSYRILHR